jgi:hypothetical protein
MSGLADAVTCYLATRRALGFKLEGAGQLLEQFAAFAEAAGADTACRSPGPAGPRPP